MLTCTKLFTEIPFAHRQWRHAGHCALVHGHNWSIAVTFACEHTDENDFVVDFGGLGYLREWIRKNLDHACVFSEDDPLRARLVEAAPEAWKVLVVPSASCEGLARHLHAQFNALVRTQTGGRAWVAAIELHEDSRNCARYSPA